MSSNSLSNQLEELHRLQTIILSNYSTLLSAQNSTDNQLQFNSEIDGEIVTNSITSPFFLSKKIDEINSNVQTLLGLNSEQVVLIDNDPQFLFLRNLRNSLGPLNNLKEIGEFSFSENEFFENFLNPLLFVEIDLSESEKDLSVNKFKIEKYITTDQSKFDEITTNISYNSFINQIDDTWLKESEILELSKKQPRFNGEFIPLQISETTDNQFEITVNTILYNDSNSETLFTEELQVGQKLVDQGGSTQFTISFINKIENKITLTRDIGFSFIKVNESLILQSQESFNSVVKLPINVNQLIVWFIAQINDKNIIGEFSTGNKLQTNNLQKTDGLITQSLTDFYTEKVIDYGRFIKNLVNLDLLTEVDGVDIPKPQLNPNSFNVVQINKHITDSNSSLEVKRLNKQKEELRIQSKQLKNVIVEKSSILNSRKFNSESEREEIQSQLNRTIENLNSTETLYTSTVNDLVTRSKTNELSNKPAKYRIRGFFDTPDELESSNTKNQKIIRYKVRYRYINVESSEVQAQQFNLLNSDNEVQKSGVFSEWIEVLTPLRESTTVDGKIIWKDLNIESSEELNFNQLDIPIQLGERVEIKICAQSEAGFPQNPKESEFSLPIEIEFPEDLLPNNEIAQIQKSVQVDQLRVELNEELKSTGINRHLQSVIKEQDKFFEHSAEVISSGFLTDEQRIISVADKLIEQQLEIQKLKEIIFGQRGQFKISVIDDVGNEFNVSDGQIIDIFAGYYEEEIADLQNSDGEIISKTYFIKIENQSSLDLELFSSFPGTLSEILSETESPEYNIVPIGIINPDTGQFGLPTGDFQTRGQICYLRQKEINNIEDVWVDDSDPHYLFDAEITNTRDSQIQYPDEIGTFPEQEKTLVVLNTDTNELVSAKPSKTFRDFLGISISHPLWIEYLTATATRKIEIIDEVKKIKNTKLATQEFELSQNGVFDDNGIKTTPKLSFDSKDKFLIGERSCGSYCYLNLKSKSVIEVSGSRLDSKLQVEPGISNSILIPVNFQFRMSDGIGNILGKLQTPQQVTYKKQIGIDLKIGLNKFISFDLRITSRLKSTTVDNSDITTKRILDILRNKQSTISTTPIIQ